jgi:hypothetical protein
MVLKRGVLPKSKNQHSGVDEVPWYSVQGSRTKNQLESMISNVNAYPERVNYETFMSQIKTQAMF